MPDIFLWPGAASNDVTLHDPTVGAGGAVAKSDADTLALTDAATTIFLATPDDPLSLNDTATIIALLTPDEALSEAEAATLIALSGVGESISAVDAATLVGLLAPDDAGNVADAATLIGLAVSESVAVVDAINALIVVVGPNEAMAVSDQPTIVAIGTPNENITVTDAVVDITAFESVGPFDDIWTLVDEVLSILEIKPPAIVPSIPGGSAPSEDGRQIVKKPLPPLKVKKLALKYEPAPLPVTVALPRMTGMQLKRMDEVTRLMALHQMGIITDEELEALSAAA